MIPAGCVRECPGCRQRDLSADESLRLKEDWLRACLSRIRIDSILSPQFRWGYRKKALLHARLVAGAWRFGLLKYEGRKEIFVAIPDCPLHEMGLNRAFAALGHAVPFQWPLVYAAVTGKAATLVLKEKRTEEHLGFLRAQEAALREAGLSSLWVNWNPAAGRRVFSSRHMELVWGAEWLCDEDVWHGPTGFRQPIPELEDRAHELAEEFFAATPANAVADLYSGLGLTLRRWERRGWASVGVELAGESVGACAKNTGAMLLRGRVEDRIPQMDEFLAGRRFHLYTNPPRMGHAAPVNEWILRSRPQRIAYLSCNAKSLARDLSALEGSYELVRIQPFDFFPQTDHVETLALLSRRG